MSAGIDYIPQQALEDLPVGWREQQQQQQQQRLEAVLLDARRARIRGALAQQAAWARESVPPAFGGGYGRGKDADTGVAWDWDVDYT